MPDQMTFGSLRDEEWLVVFNSPIAFEVLRQREDDGQEWAIAYVAGYRHVSECLAEKTGDLWDTIVPAMVLGILKYPPTEESDEDYQHLYNYLRNSVERIVVEAPIGMKLGRQVDERSIELEFTR